jgi:hypothetical protein
MILRVDQLILDYATMKLYLYCLLSV